MQLRNNHTFTDVQLEIDGQIFNAHKVILAGASPYFKVTTVHKIAKFSIKSLRYCILSSY